LCAAAQRGHLSVVELLLKKGTNHGANIHQASDQGVTPLHQAALEGHQEVVDYLMGNGATFEATGTLAKVCECCGADDVSLKCALCLTVYYCCKDWKEGGENSHRVQCKNLAELKARYGRSRVQELAGPSKVGLIRKS
jgi:ankyrin repeat protein